MIDLNEPPLDVESVNISVELGTPFLHAVYEQEDHHLVEGVGESLDPNIGSNTTHVSNNHVPAPPPMVAPANALVHEARELEDEEAGSQPQQPYVGMRFDTLEDPREHYNRYALMEGFQSSRIRLTGRPTQACWKNINSVVTSSAKRLRGLGSWMLPRHAKTIHARVHLNKMLKMMSRNTLSRRRGNEKL